MIVKLTAASPDFPDLTAGQTYCVIGIEADDYRILNDFGKPYIYPRHDFILIDATEPTDWVLDVGMDGERYAYPPSLNESGFFEDFFDGVPSAVATFWHVVNRRLSQAA